MFKKLLLVAALVVMPFVSSMAIDCSKPVQTLYINPVPGISSMASFDGYVFLGYSYIDAANYWYDKIYKSPCGYKAQPPVYSVSVQTTVSGTVPGGN